MAEPADPGKEEPSSWGGGWFGTTTTEEKTAPSLWSTLSAVAESLPVALNTAEAETEKGLDADLDDLLADDSPKIAEAATASNNNDDDHDHELHAAEEEPSKDPDPPAPVGFLDGVNTEEELADKLEETITAAVSTISSMAGNLSAAAIASTTDAIENPTTADTASSFFSSLGSTVLSEYNSKVNQAAGWIGQLDEEAARNDPLYSLDESLDHYLSKQAAENNTQATYEAWIRGYIEHDDEFTGNNSATLDAHYYAEDSPHLRVWNERCHRDGIDIHDASPPRHYVMVDNKKDGDKLTPKPPQQHIQEDEVDVEVISFGDDHNDDKAKQPLLPHSMPEEPLHDLDDLLGGVTAAAVANPAEEHVSASDNV